MKTRYILLALALMVSTIQVAAEGYFSQDLTWESYMFDIPTGHSRELEPMWSVPFAYQKDSTIDGHTYQLFMVEGLQHYYSGELDELTGAATTYQSECISLSPLDGGEPCYGSPFFIFYGKEDIWHFGIFVREENKRIYLRRYDIHQTKDNVMEEVGEEVLVTDFNLEVGDSLPICIPDNPQPYYLKVIETDSITLYNGKRAKRIFYDHALPDIEYIGSAGGLNTLLPESGNIFKNQSYRYFGGEYGIDDAWKTYVAGATFKVGSKLIYSSAVHTALWCHYYRPEGWQLACEEEIPAPAFSTWIYFEDKEGLRDSLLVGMDTTASFGLDEEWETVVSDDEIAQWKDETFKAYFKFWDRHSDIPPYFTRTCIVPPLDTCEIIEHGYFDMLFPVDRLPVTITWDKEAFATPKLDHSIITDYGALDCVGEGDEVLETMSQTDHITVRGFSEERIVEHYKDVIDGRLMRRIKIAFGNRVNRYVAYEYFSVECWNIWHAIDEVPAGTIRLAPNPAKNYLRVEGDVAVKEIIITDMQGQVLRQAADKQIDVRGLASGAYIAQVWLQGGTQKAQLFLKE